MSAVNPTLFCGGLVGFLLLVYLVFAALLCKRSKKQIPLEQYPMTKKGHHQPKSIDVTCHTCHKMLVIPKSTYKHFVCPGCGSAIKNPWLAWSEVKR